jgi:hypothetical protein
MTLIPLAQTGIRRGRNFIGGQKDLGDLGVEINGAGQFCFFLLHLLDQLHICSRGVAHSSRAAAGEEFWLLCFFSDSQSPTGDRVMIDE